MKLVVTGGAGFIGSAVVRLLINNTDVSVINVDKLTYAGNLESLTEVENHPRYFFECVDICNVKEVSKIFRTFAPDAIMHLAAESHVDRSIEGPSEFVQTNVVGTSVLLEVARGYWSGLDEVRKQRFRFHHVSTDEVYGSLGDSGYFTEQTPYHPNSPYSASKASSDHLVKAWHRTYGLPVVITNCSNNYGPYQFPEKLIPLMILNGLEGKQLPVYGRGDNVRDWLYVEDHASALWSVLRMGRVGETYAIGGHNEKTNLEVVRGLCANLDELAPHPNGKSYSSLIIFVEDRPGHDKRYAINASKIAQELHWTPDQTFESGLRQTVQWYLENQRWCRRVQNGSYQRERLGLLESAK